MNAQVLGISVDSVPCLQAWAESLGGISYPLLSDFWPHGAVAERYGVLRAEGKSERAIYLIDGQGIIRYADVHDIDEQPSNEVLLEEIRRIDPEAAQEEAATRPPRAQLSEQERAELDEAEAADADLVMYCTPWCPDCRRAARWLRENGIRLVEVDITKSSSAAERVREWSNGDLVTPTFDVRGTIVVDYDRQRLGELLDI